ncbi:MAG: hypothetical protein AAF288_03140 [Planctomycetota bacterium]
MLRQTRSIAWNTFLEAIRRPSFIVILFAAALALGLNLINAAYSMEAGDGDNKMLVDMGLSMLVLGGLALAVSTAVSAVTREIESRTVLTVVSKPIPRAWFVVSKFLGAALAVTLGFALLSCVFLFTWRHRVLQNASDPVDWPVLVLGVGSAILAVGAATWANYFLRRVWTSSAVFALAVALPGAAILLLFVGKGWAFQSPATEFQAHDGELVQVLIGILLAGQAVLLLTAVAIALSTRFNEVLTLTFTLLAFALGGVSQSLIQPIDEALGAQAPEPAPTTPNPTDTPAPAAASGNPNNESPARAITAREGGIVEQNNFQGAGFFGPFERFAQVWTLSELRQSLREDLDRSDERYDQDPRVFEQQRRLDRQRFERLTQSLELSPEQRAAFSDQFLRTGQLPEPILQELEDRIQLPLGKKLLYTAGAATYLAAPNLQFLFAADAITQGRPLTFGYFLQTSAYALAYLIACLALAVALFETRDVG